MRFLAGLALLAALAGIFAGWVLPRLQIETDLLALLPDTASDARTGAALDSFAARSSRKVIYLVSSAEPETARRAARAFAAQLGGSGAFESVHSEVGGNLDEMRRIYTSHRPFLLSRERERQLKEGQAERIYRDALRSAYSPGGLFRPLSVAEDPLGLGSDYLLAQLPSASATELDGDQLVAYHDGRTFVVVTAEVAGSAFSADAQAAVQQARERADKAAMAAGKDVAVLASGVLQHAASATRKARTEISLFGTIDTAFVLTLMLALFFSWRAPALGVLALASGGVAGLVTAHFIFGAVHLIALVFGTSLIGVAIDYAMHFFSDQFRAPRHWSPAQALDHVGRPILLGLAVALLGYFSLTLLPFPGLKQMSVISIAGLVVACACVFTIFPRWAQGSGRALPAWCSRGLSRIESIAGRLREPRVGIPAGFLALALIGIGVSRLDAQDDLRSLQGGDPQALRDDKQVRDILESEVDSRFFVVMGSDAEAALQTEERLTAVLDGLISKGSLDRYTAVTRALPSLARQHEVKTLLQKEIYAADGILPRFMRELGFGDSAITRAREDFDAPSQPLTPQDWIASPASQPYRHLWLGARDGEQASVVLLEGIHDAAAVRAAAQIPGVQFIDRVADISAVLACYRHTVLLLLLGIYVVISIALTLRYGWCDALRLVMAPAGATALTLAVAGWTGLPLTLFVALALLLLLGLGVDYAIFLREAGAERRTALLAITLSALTTMVSFGLLSFSSTPLIAAIGKTLAVGIASCWLLAVVGDALRRQGPHEN